MLVEQQDEKINFVSGGCGRRRLLEKLKCNIDSIIFVESGHMGCAAIVRNEIGSFVRCISSFMKMVEIIAAREAFFGFDHCMDGVILKIVNLNRMPRIQD
ncbi:hypothetical protein Goshw_029294 [Gossypium schwendimanii]|uniref:Uncharacterized protein n=1 Tax=Gossypium schwendimanii TaxID=34291 RepID=A0A7J9LS26_GOSSC|nr:hypothetical protein [Gossypium schwendimanii]